MDISDIILQDYEERHPDTKVSKLVGTFSDTAVRGVVIADGEYRGIVTRRQLANSHYKPNAKVISLIKHVPRVAPDADIRSVAGYMVDSDVHLLPVFENETLLGVVTADSILEKVKPFLDSLRVREVYTPDLTTLDPESTLGQAINRYKEQRITHLPVVESDTAIGILSLYDITGLMIRAEMQSQGGDAGGVDAFGQTISSSSANTRRGGYGAREGDIERMLDLPVRDVMSAPVEMIHPGATLETAVDEMNEINASSLVVTDDGSPHGIVTNTDVLDSLTWEVGGNRGVQIYGVDLLDDMQYDQIVSMIDSFDDRDRGMSVIDAKIHLQEHDETKRGRSMVLARIRLYTDRGQFVGSGEGYGARHAINEARHVLERQIRDRKTYGQSKKPPGEEFWEKRFGWLLKV